MNDEAAASAPWGVDRWLAAIGVLVGLLGVGVAAIAILLVDESKKNAERLLHAYGSLVLAIFFICLLIIAGGFALWTNKHLRQTQHEKDLLTLENTRLSKQNKTSNDMLAEAQAKTRALEKIRDSRPTGGHSSEKQCQDLERENTFLKQRVEAVLADLGASGNLLQASEAKILALQSELKARPAFKKHDTPRWDLIVKQRQVITYGHMAYDPFLRYDEETNPDGPGLQLLRDLLEGFEVEGTRLSLLPDPKNDRNWTTIFDGLAGESAAVDGVAGEPAIRKPAYEIVATPLFSTFTRTKTVSFSSPLFFSNIGLYVHKNIAALSPWNRYFKDTSGRLSVEKLRVEDLQSAISSTRNLKFFGIKNEISEGLAETHHHGAEMLCKESGYSMKSLFKSLADPREPRAMFYESFSAAHFSEVKNGDVVNVLKDHEFLYPVCFAVRLADYQLVNLVNIRLLELGAKKPLVQRLFEKLEGWKEGDPPIRDEQIKELKRHFVAEWPCPIDFDHGTEVSKHA